jgi:VID27 N-terminal region
MHVRDIYFPRSTGQLNGIPFVNRYNDAMATIRRVPSVEHNFQLVITRVYEEGDQELLEDEEESASYVASLSPNLTVP